MCYNEFTILMEVLPWLIRSLLLASAAALALIPAPSALSALVMTSMSSTQVPAWTAVLAATLAPTAPSSPRNNLKGIHKSTVSLGLRYFLFSSIMTEDAGGEALGTLGNLETRRIPLCL